MLKTKDIIKLRLIGQQLLLPQFSAAKELVAWMGAIQAQDFKASLSAVNLRLKIANKHQSATLSTIEAAFNNGDFLRTHVLRPTWHLVAAEDIRWMLELSAPRIKSQAHARDLAFGLTEDVFEQSNAVFTKALAGGRHLVREELAEFLQEAGLEVDNHRMYHYLMRAELDAVICSGALRGKQQTYALLSERAPGAKCFDKETSLAMLSQRYFASRGPATLKDFTWWSGLTTTNAKLAIDLVRGAGTDIVSDEIDGQTYYFNSDLFAVAKAKKIPAENTRLLPAFDEYIIAYADRTLVLPPEHASKAVTSNGIFRPTILQNGKVIGTWKMSGKQIGEFLF